MNSKRIQINSLMNSSRYRQLNEIKKIVQDTKRNSVKIQNARVNSN
jgi:hypothetical protein